MKRFALFIVAFVVGLVVSKCALAETIAASDQTTWSGGYTTPDEACQNIAQAFKVASDAEPSFCTSGGTVTIQNTSVVGQSGSYATCAFTWFATYDANPSVTCAYSQTTNQGMSATTQLGCPSGQGWTLQGSNCIRPDCDYPTTRGSGGSCVNPTCPAAGTAAGPFGGEGTIGTTVNLNGCKIDCDTVLRAAGAWGAAGCKYTGTPADVGSGGDTDADTIPPEQPTTTPQSCMAGGQGYVTNSSGVTSCVPANQMPLSNPITVTNTSNSSTSGPAGSSTSSTSTSQTCAGGNCSVSQTTTNGSGTTTGNWSNVGGFCTDNPNSPLCKAQGDGKTDCDKYPNASGCKELGTPTEETGLDAQSIGVSSITPVTLAMNMNCPAPLELPRGLGAFSFTPACDLAGMVRPIVLLFAWIAAGMIVIGAARNG